MGDYERSTAVQVPPARLFSYLADVANLPAYPAAADLRHTGTRRQVDVTAHIDPLDGPPRDAQSQTWTR